MVSVDVPLLVFAIIELAAFGCAFGAVRNVNREHEGAVRKALTSLFAPRTAFTERGWALRSWSFRLQAVAILWVLVSALIF